MKKEYIDRLNQLIEKYIISSDRVRPTGAGYFQYSSSEGKSYFFMREDEKGLSALASDIINNDSRLKGTLSVEAAMREFLYLIKSCKKEGRYTDNNEVAKMLEERIYSLPISEFEVFHGIRGTYIQESEPITIGRFTFYNLPNHRKWITDEYHPGVSDDDILPLIDQLAKYQTWVSVKVSARDSYKVEQLADEMLERLQNLLRYLVSYLGDYWDIGVFNYREVTYDDRIVLSKSGGTISHSAVPGSMESVELTSLFSRCEEYGVTPKQLIESIGDKDASKMRKRLLTAVDLYGRAFHDAHKSIGFLEAMMAIEALLQMNTEALVNQSISAQISEYCAFLLGKTTEERLNIESTVKKLYSTRSKLAHGNVVSVDTKENTGVMVYARSLIELFMTDPTLKHMSNENELRNYIQRFKYR